MQAIKTAIITGASSGGIGYEIGLKCLQQGFRVVLSDNDSTSLATAKKDLAALGYGDDKVLYSETDVTNVEAMRKLKADAFKFGGNVDLLVLNAGIQIPTKDFGEDLESWKKVMDVNFYGVLNGTQVFVADMIAQKTPARVVITGSKQGITQPPGNPSYNTSKAAVKALAESLSHSLLDTQVKVNLLIPGYTHSKLTSKTGEKHPLSWTAEQVASELFSRMDKEFYIICSDGMVDWQLDSARMEWSANDILQKRAPLSRWNPEYKEEFEAFIAKKTSK